MSLKKRIEDLGDGLTPRELVILWMKDAHEFQSLAGYLSFLKEQPEEAFPLVKMPRQIGEAAKAHSKGKSQDEVRKELYRARRDLCFLFHLHNQLNQRLYFDLEALTFRSQFLGEQLERLLDRIQVSGHLNSLSWDLELEWPYPLDEETARAVKAAEGHSVETWKMVEEGDIVQEWVDEQYKREGRSELPPGAGWSKKGEPAPFPFVAPPLEKLRLLFGSEAAWQAYLADADFSYGFADVADGDYEARHDAVEAALAKLVEAGQVKEGSLLHLESVPYEFLKDAPLVHGQWIDRHVILLAEWGALLSRSGFALEYPSDNHPLAISRIRENKSKRECEPDEERIEALKNKTETPLADFPGRVKIIDGRPYLHLADYLSWPKRSMKGNLRRKLEKGMVRESFNAWVRDQGKEAILAGVGVQPLSPWTAEYPRQIVAASALPERRKERQRILAGLTRFRLLAQESPRTTAAGRQDPEEFREEASAWPKEAAECEEMVTVYLEAARLLSRRYFSGQDLLYPASSEQLSSLLRWLASAGDLYRERVAPKLEGHREPDEMTEEKGQDATPSVIETKQAIFRLAKEKAEELVILAKAEALDSLGEKNQGIRLVEDWMRAQAG